MTRSGRRVHWPAGARLARLRPAGASVLRRLADRLAPGEEEGPVAEPAASAVAQAETPEAPVSEPAPAEAAVTEPAAAEAAPAEPPPAGPESAGGPETTAEPETPAEAPAAGAEPPAAPWPPAGGGVGTLAPERHAPARTAAGRRRSGRAYPASRRSAARRVGSPAAGGHRATAGRAHAAPEPVDLAAGYRVWMAAGDERLGLVRATGEFEPEVTDTLSQLLTPGAVMVDVGASFGAHTVHAARAVGAGGRVLAFEPAPAAQSLLLLNVAANGLGNVEVDAAALGPAAGAMLRRRSGGAGPVAFDGSAESLRDGSLVVARTLDRAVAGVRRVDVVRIGSARAVAGVLAGATETLWRHRPALLFPLRDGDGAGEVMALLGQAGYRVDVAGGQGGAWLPFARVEALVAQARRAPAGSVEILALPAGG